MRLGFINPLHRMMDPTSLGFAFGLLKTQPEVKAEECTCAAVYPRIVLHPRTTQYLHVATEGGGTYSRVAPASRSAPFARLTKCPRTC